MDPAHKAAFLGPKGENADELERLLLEVLRDHVFWRRNFHPSDPRFITERDKRTEPYDAMTARLRDRLFQILAELKRGAPLYSPRQIAHIVSDPTLPALVGYFAGLLYNQNNVVAEVSPETVREERAYLSALARMVSYPPLLPETLPPEAQAKPASYSWGHLCSGGTVANLEALWIARNVRLYPLAIRLLAATETAFASFDRISVRLATGTEGPLGDLSTFQLANLPVDAITELYLQVQGLFAEADHETVKAFRKALPTVRNAGLAGFLLRYNDAFPEDPARLPRVLTSQAAHYCWKKNLDLVGLGADALDQIPFDARVRLDTDALAARLHACAREQQPVLAVVSICGTTEEASVDPLHEIEALRTDLAEKGLTFWHHCDAAFGGFFASMLPKGSDGSFLPAEALPPSHPLAGKDALIDAEVYRSIVALGATDSLAVDPHKFGYIPYPAGAVLFRDYHVRDAIAYAAPYLSDEERTGFSGFLGQWTLEGSRPGAAAVSCYLSQAVLPLDDEGHGRLMQRCIAANKMLVPALKQRFRPDGPLELAPLAEPDTVGFCFALVPRDGIRSGEALNSLSRRIWRRMTVDGREDINQYDFLLSKTEVDVGTYRHLLKDSLDESLLDEAARNEVPLVLLRTCIMNPLLHEWNEREPSFSEGFADYLYQVAQEEHQTLSASK